MTDLTDAKLKAEIDDCPVYDRRCNHCEMAAALLELRAENEALKAEMPLVMERSWTDLRKQNAKLEAQNAKLVAAGNRLSVCYKFCICEPGPSEPDCKGWPMLKMRSPA